MLFKKLLSIKPGNKFPEELDGSMSHYEKAAVILSAMPHGVNIRTLDSTRKLNGKRKSYRYTAQYKLGKQVYGDTLFDVVSKLESQHKELRPN